MSSSSGYSTDSGDSINSFGNRASEDSSYASQGSAHAQLLLQALQNYIVPLVNMPSSQNKNDSTNQILWAPEAGKFLTALQDFISFIIRSHSEPGNKNVIEVDLNDDENKTIDSLDDFTPSILSDTETSVEVFGDDFTSVSEESSECCQGAFEQIPQLTPLKRMLATLRERVFNQMPIRLLHIVPKESKLQIRLLERAEVYAQLAAQLETDYSESIFHTKVEKGLDMSWELESDSTSTEENVIEEWVSQYAKYAILSHTWARAGGEVTYDNWRQGKFDLQQRGYQKLLNFCKAAWTNHGLTLGWMDTVCIDKQSSSELDESIRSMYKWYQNAALCVTYLSGTREASDMHQDLWFTRGWTFQELLTPRDTKFYNMDWQKLVDSTDSDKNDCQILHQIHKATTITYNELINPDGMSISRKMQLAAKRKVMREEDIAYSLMGIFGVSIPIAYGEGAKRAFVRLMREVLNSSSHVLDVFNCSQTSSSSLIPSTPSAYIHRSTNIVGLDWEKTIEPLIFTHLGLRIPVLLMPSLQEDDPNFKNDPIGDFYATADFPKQQWQLAYTGSFRILDKGTWIAPKLGGPYHTTFGILNFGGDKTSIRVPNTCLAVAFWVPRDVEWESTSTSIRRHDTQEPIVFELMKKRIDSHINYGYSIKRSKLAKHGMKLVTMYL